MAEDSALLTRAPEAVCRAAVELPPLSFSRALGFALRRAVAIPTYRVWQLEQRL